jgi:hypothetical protein
VTVFVQYFDKDTEVPSKPFKSLPPVPTVTTGQQIGARLVLHNDHVSRTTQNFTVRKKILNSMGTQVAYSEETQSVGYGLVAYFPITTTNTPRAGNYTADFQVYIGSALWAAWQGNPNVSPTKLIAIVKDPATPPPDIPDDGGTPPPPPTDPAVTYFVGEFKVNSVDQLMTKTSITAAFKAGENGIAKMQFPIPIPEQIPAWSYIFNPFGLILRKYGLEFSKAAIADRLNSEYKAKGVTLWTPVYWEGNTLCIPFTTGIAPLVILAIALAVALIAGTVLTVIAVWKVGIAYIEAKKTGALAGQDQILKAISLIEDPELQAATLLKYLGMASSGVGGGGGTGGGTVWGELFSKPILILTIVATVAIAALVVIKVVKK